MLVFSIASVQAPANAATTGIRLAANPSAIYADGKSICSISAEVRDGSGGLISDGAQVRFASSLGVIDAAATTTGGVARAILRSGTQSGQAMVSAVLTSADGQAVSQTQVQFLPPGTRVETDACLTISSDRYLAYAADSRIVDASGGTTVRHRGLTVQAEDIQVDMGRNMLTAKAKTGGTLQVSRGGKSVRASVLAYDLGTLQGAMVAEGTDGKMAKLRFSGADLSTAPLDQGSEQSTFEFVDLSAASVLVKAKSITIRPKHDVQFKKAELYMDGGKALKLPLYLIPLAAAGPTAGFQYLSLTSNGLKVDIPLYYSLSPSGTGAIRLRNQQGGWSQYSSLPGWGLDLEQSYATGKAEGRFTVSQVTRRDWGVDWEHRHEFGSGATVNAYLGFPAHRNLNGIVSFNKPFKSSSLGVNLHGSDTHGFDKLTRTDIYDRTVSTDVYFQTNPRPLTNRLNYSVTLQSSLYSQNHKAVSKTTTATSDIPFQLSSGLQFQLFADPVRFGRKSVLNTSLSLGHLWGGSRAGLSTFGNAMFTRSFSDRSNLALGYSYMLNPGSLGDYGRHRVSLNFGSFGTKWQTSLFVVHTLDQPITSAYGSIGYHLNPRWRIDVRGNLQRFNLYNSSDIEFGLGTLIGQQDITLAYSRSFRRFRVELGALGF